MASHRPTAPTYYDLLYEAYAASVAVDDFDLLSEDPASERQWAKLLKANAQAQAALVEHVIRNATAILLECELLVQPVRAPRRAPKKAKVKRRR